MINWIDNIDSMMDDLVAFGYTRSQLAKLSIRVINILWSLSRNALDK